MLRVLLTTTALIATFATAAVAADLPRQMPTKAPAVYMPVGYNLTGLYIGVNGGYAWGSSDWSGFASSNKPDGGMIGGTIGYNWQAPGSAWVFGLEGDMDWADFKGSFANAACPTGCQTKINWQGTARGRLGYAWDRVMPYVTGGLAVGEVEANQGGFAGARDTKAGWTVGGGVEAALAGNWTAKIEYLHVDLGSTNCGLPSCSLPTSVNFTADEVRGGLNYRF
ncbi:MAG: outer membrane protein [Hyphomicrobiales bacterium]